MSKSTYTCDNTILFKAKHMRNCHSFQISASLKSIHYYTSNDHGYEQISGQMELAYRWHTPFVVRTTQLAVRLRKSYSTLLGVSQDALDGDNRRPTRGHLTGHVTSIALQHRSCNFLLINFLLYCYKLPSTANQFLPRWLHGQMVIS